MVFFWRRLFTHFSSLKIAPGAAVRPAGRIYRGLAVGGLAAVFNSLPYPLPSAFYTPRCATGLCSAFLTHAGSLGT